MTQRILRIGTRTSPLALKQTDLFLEQFQKLHPGIPYQIVPIVTTGDRTQKTNQSLAVIGGKGLFLKELERALADHTIDMAIHSLKDVPAFVGSDFAFPCVLEREDPRDAFVSVRYGTLSDLPPGARLGSCSQRRQAQAVERHPHLITVPFRGNVGSRMEKLDRGEVDATFLAMAGLKRLGLEDRATHIFSVDEMIPCAGQGAITVEARGDDIWVQDLLKPLNHDSTIARITMERAVVATLGGGCTTPIGVHADWDDACWRLRVFLGTVDGSTIFRITMHNQENLGAKAFGFLVGRTLHAQVDPFLKTALGLLQKTPDTVEEMSLTTCGS